MYGCSCASELAESGVVGTKGWCFRCESTFGVQVGRRSIEVFRAWKVGWAFLSLGRRWQTDRLVSRQI